MVILIMIMCLLLESFKFFCFNNIAKAAIAVLWEIPGREAMMEITMEITMTMTAILMTMTMIMMLMIDDDGEGDHDVQNTCCLASGRRGGTSLARLRPDYGDDYGS